MKRIVLLVLVSLLILSFVGCGEKKTDDATAEGIVGVWKFSPNEEYREIITEAITDPGVYVDLFYEFYADGTGKTYLSTDEDPMEFTYTYDGETLTITNRGTSFDTPVRLKGDILSVYDASTGEYMDLKRQ